MMAFNVPGSADEAALLSGETIWHCHDVCGNSTELTDFVGEACCPVHDVCGYSIVC